MPDNHFRLSHRSRGASHSKIQAGKRMRLAVVDVGCYTILRPEHHMKARFPMRCFILAILAGDADPLYTIEQSNNLHALLDNQQVALCH